MTECKYKGRECKIKMSPYYELVLCFGQFEVCPVFIEREAQRLSQLEEIDLERDGAEGSLI